MRVVQYESGISEGARERESERARAERESEGRASDCGVNEQRFADYGSLIGDCPSSTICSER
jgi:hypothetical protein